MERTIKPETLKPLLEKAAIQLLDVRRKNDLETDKQQLPGATWCDPEKMAEWSKTIHKDKPIVIYCVRGGSVSNSVVDHLHQQGIDARFIEGGIEGWKTAGGKTIVK